MTEAEIAALQQEVDTLRAANDDLTAERDSLREENAELIAARDAAQTEAQETKKLNFTLARQLDTKPRETFENVLLKSMGVK
jgi:septal ring factor EnvC (AmiA/AmiB activator)